MSNKFKAMDNDKAYFTKLIIIYWIDVFTQVNHKNTVIESLKHCQPRKGLAIYTYVLMPSHLRLMCRAKKGFELANKIRDFKKYTSKKIFKNIRQETKSGRGLLLELSSKACKHLKKDEEFKVWQDGFDAERLVSDKSIYQKLNYMENNPVNN